MRVRILVLVLVLNGSLFSQVQINFASSNNQPERQAVIAYLLNAFELQYPQVQVNLVPYRENDSVDEILGAAGDSKIHLIMADSVLFSRLSKKADVDYGLTGKIANSLDVSDFYSGAIEACRRNDSFCLIPYSAWLQAIWYRKDWFDEENLPYPTTLESLSESSHLFSSRTDRYGVVIGSGDTIYTQQCFLHLAGACGLTCPSEENCIRSMAAISKALDCHIGLKNSGPPGVMDWRGRDYFFQSKAAMLFYSTLILDDLAIPEIAADSLTADNFSDLEGGGYPPDFLSRIGYVTTLSDDTTASFGSVSGIGIFRSGDEDVRDAQERLIRFLFREDVYITWLHMSPGGMLPVKRSLLENEDFYHDASGVLARYGQEQIRELVEGLEHVKVINPELFPLSEQSADGGELTFQNILHRIILEPEKKEYLLGQISWTR